MLPSRGLALMLVLLAAACDKDLPSDDSKLEPSPFHKVSLDDQPGEPIALAVLPDGRILHTTRTGTVWLHELDGAKHVAASIPVYLHDEEGLQGIAIDPEFEQNRWVYLYYSPPLNSPSDDPSTPDVDEGAAPATGSADTWTEFQGVMRLSRFIFDVERLDMSSEQIILEVPVDRGMCCHIAGQIDFDGAGNLYLSTGDDTNPFFSGGYTPIDDRPGQHPAFDAQRSSANTNDLRGKLLRIRVAADGTYVSPEGNLFPAGSPRARPEIYAMGLRNPFRFSINRRTGDIYLADYAPDAPTDNPLRGPAGTGKWVIIRGPGNYGWPYCATPQRPYVEFDFGSGLSGQAFDCNRPRNESPNNTGLVDLPPVSPSEVSYSYAPSSSFPELGFGGIGPMAGPAYEYDELNGSPGKWPRDYSGAPLFYDWVRDFVAAFHLGDDGVPRRVERLRFAVDNPIDMEFGPDGALYVLEYGDGYYSENPDAQLARIEYFSTD